MQITSQNESVIPAKAGISALEWIIDNESVIPMFAEKKMNRIAPFDTTSSTEIFG
jgi:hypothetical protein